MNAVEATVADVGPVFEKAAATFSATIKGPSKPSSVVLVHQGKAFYFSAVTTASISFKPPLSINFSQRYHI